jgi:RNA polymerase sigma factor for flagellar operon FliA
MAVDCVAWTATQECNMTRTHMDVQSVWREYKKTKCPELKNRLIQQYLPLVKYTAERVWAKLPDEVEVDDLYSAGVFGLMAAVDGFKPERGFKFETYCAPRIRGAILDYLRSVDWVPRLVRSRSHKLDRAVVALEAKLGRKPSEEEAAEYLAISMDEYHKLVRDATAVSQISLSKKWYETDGNKDVREIDVIDDKRGEDPMRDLQLRDVKQMITRGLNRTERLIVILYYYENLTMKEIGATLELSESRVSQMHSSIIARLKSQLAERRSEFAA